MTRRVGLLLFPGFDLLDAGGPYEVLLTASRLAERDGRAPLYEMVPLSVGGQDAAAFGGLTVTGLTPVEEAHDLHLVIVPGLIDVDAARADGALIAAVKALGAEADVVASVCTGAFLLADAGLLDGLPATTHWEDVDALAATASVGEAVPGVRWVDAGAVVTGGAIASGLHTALHLVAREHGVDHARRTARQIDLDWEPEPGR